MAEESPQPSADRLGPYRIVRQIGRGGQATVYLAEDTRLHRQVALKVLDPGPATDKSSFERFRREAEITSKLDHPGICTVYETGEDRGSLWIAMRYVEGESLAKKISTAKESQESSDTTSFVVVAERAGREDATPDGSAGEPSSGPKTWTEIARVLALFEEAARTLHVAHEHGVIHRDIKPGNIIVTQDGEPVILDFGLAQEMQGDQPTLTLTGDIMGTPAYMSPEQIAAQRIRLDRRTDVYSLGVSLYECLTLKRPFDAPTREGLYQAILTKDPPDARHLNQAVPQDLKVVLETAIDKDRDRRYQTALDLAEDIRRVRVHEPILAKPVGRLVRLRRWSQRNPALATAVLGLFVVLLTGLTISLVLLDETRRERDAKEAERRRADTNAQELRAALAEYERLADVKRLQDLVTEAESLWPAHPHLVGQLVDWLQRAEKLRNGLSSHREAVTALRKQIGEWAASHVASLKDVDLEWRHDTLAKLVADLDVFLDPDPKKGLLADVRGRLAFAESVRQKTIRDYEAKWADAIRSISDKNECPTYNGLVITRQVGLIPIAKDPASGLWEFVHLQTAAPESDPIPKRDKDGRLIVTESMGLVFVLIPGGTFKMGATKPDELDASPTDPNIDPDAVENESPLTEIALDPFFLCKYEMTQGQWQRLVGTNPSQYGPRVNLGGKMVDLRNPVEQVSWEDCDLWLTRLGLVLPTEAQWEYGARGGTTTPRWTGLGTDELAGAANLADAFCRRHGGHPSWKYDSWDDGYTFHAPVGSFAPNPFGLHDVLGNVWEWCRDWFNAYGVAADPGDGLRRPSAQSGRVIRSGSYDNIAKYARSATRNFAAPGVRSGNLGVRPAMSCRPD